MSAKCPHLSHCVPQLAPDLSRFAGEDNERNFLFQSLTGQQCEELDHPGLRVCKLVQPHQELLNHNPPLNLGIHHAELLHQNQHVIG